MFQDLKEENWSEKNKLINNTILKDMLIGKDVSTELINNQVQNDFLNELPIVMDADSSQYNAIKDVIDGKNVIIEGPPGTGKVFYLFIIIIIYHYFYYYSNLS